MRDIMNMVLKDLKLLIEKRWTDCSQLLLDKRKKDKLVKTRRQLREQWREATVDEREGIIVLPEERVSWLAVLRKAEQLKKEQKNKKHNMAPNSDS